MIRYIAASESSGNSGLNVRLRMDGLAALAREITTDLGAAA